MNARICRLSTPTAFHPSAQGWREATTLGNASQSGSTLNGLNPRAPECFNPFRVEEVFAQQPRVATASQPWAEGWNPVGVLRTKELC